MLKFSTDKFSNETCDDLLSWTQQLDPNKSSTWLNKWVGVAVFKHPNPMMGFKKASRKEKLKLPFQVKGKKTFLSLAITYAHPTNIFYQASIIIATKCIQRLIIPLIKKKKKNPSFPINLYLFLFNGRLCS